MAKSEKKVVYVDSKGKRLDGRKVDEMRPIKITTGVLDRADGSALIEWGQNKVFAAVYGPKEALPRHIANPYKAVIRYNYRMATFSVPDRKNPKPGRREIEISKVSAEALEAVVLTERYPNTAIDVDVEVVDSNAGTRVAALTAAAVAVADAGIALKDLIAGVSIGKAGGNLLVDLNKDEEDAEDAVDIPIAIMPGSEQIVLLQLDGLLSKKEWSDALKMGLEACKKVNELQRAALKEKFGRKEEKVSE
ncbi:MAG: exosome complex exonuclease Rrp41 [Candidatus Diapherotrites archaeon]|uniref:Exosome complex exonuclease Rrp41 n=1 Tax=Candidatus Iainarchaeum sp. TaxID=3101447 RepID=A0A7J4IQR9_9ARCH|nr:MAG: exosome complex component RRP41 [archaeon GW2011_AR10]MBS3059706.1 exosome complex exonuclease Rrp41 [Candidatus Diapherotrites archaeon]HIH07838.1 exosome complex exonuclease Rrp41 [Candidatus Diapherotrites archaeon]